MFSVREAKPSQIIGSLDCGHLASKRNPEIAARCRGAWCRGVEHLGKKTKTSPRAVRRGQEGDEGAQNQTLADIILRTGTESRWQWQELRLTRLVLPYELDRRNLLPVVQKFISALGGSNRLVFLPCLNAALHLPSPLPCFPLALCHLLKPGEAKTGVTFYFYSFPCSGALISSAHLSPNDSRSAFPKACASKPWAGTFF